MRVGHLFLAVAIAGCVGGSFGETNLGRKSEDFPPLPPKGTQSYSLPNNAGIVQFDWTVTDTGQEGTYIGPRELECINRCKGQKHLAHPSCDFSCDDRCTRLHRLTERPFSGFPQEWTSFLPRDLNSAAGQFGTSFDANAVAQAIYEQITAGAEHDDRYKVEFNSACWNDKPCSRSTKSLTRRYLRVVLDWQYYRFDTRPDGSKARVQGPKGQLSTLYFIPLNRPMRAHLEVLCSCDVVRRIPEERSSLRQIEGRSPKTTPGARPAGSMTPPAPGPGSVLPATWEQSPFRVGFIGTSYKEGTPIDGEFIKKVGLKAICPNLSTCQLTATNPTDKPLTFTVCAGVVFICIPGNGEGAQDTILVQDLRFNLPPLGSQTLYAQIGRVGSRDPNAPTPMPLEGRVLCLNIAKRAPTKDDVFGIALPQNEELALIAKKGGAQLVQGPWDQARIWIVSDAATLAMVDERMNPPVGAPFYLRSMQEAAEWGNVDFGNERYRRCLEPKLALAIEAGPKAVRWFAETMMRVDPMGFTQFVNEHLADFAAKCAPGRTSDHVERIVALASGLLASQDASGHVTAIALLEKGIPEAARKDFATFRSMPALNTFLMSSSDEANVGELLRLASELKPKYLATGCLNVNPKLPEAFRAKGQEVAAMLPK